MADDKKKGKKKQAWQLVIYETCRWRQYFLASSAAQLYKALQLHHLTNVWIYTTMVKTEWRFNMKLDWAELTPVDLCFRCVIAHSLITSSASNLNWQQQLIIPFVFSASVLSGLRLKVNGLHRNIFDQLYQELIGHVETNAKSKWMPRSRYSLILWLSYWEPKCGWYTFVDKATDMGHRCKRNCLHA